MSSNAVVKALNIPVPRAVYVLDIPAGDKGLFPIPGVDEVIGGAAPQGRHGMVTNWITLKAEGAGIYVVFGPSTVQIDSTVATPTNLVDPPPAGYNLWWSPPSVVTGACVLLEPGVEYRWNLDDLFEHGAAPALIPIDYLALENASASQVRVRLWRSSGR